MAECQVVGPDDVGRAQVIINGTEYRMYNDGSTEYPSVSTILSARPTPDKDKAIQGWRNWLKGQPDRPDPDELIDYKSWRGTLAHWAILNPLAKRDLTGDEERTAHNGLNGWEYRHDDALKQAENDVSWCEHAFQALAQQQHIASYGSEGEVHDHNVRAVERYIIEHDVGYGGQFDLAYDHPTRGTVVADLKTSKADSVSDLLNKKWPRYGMQLAAYSRGATFDVDACEVLWLSPDTHKSAVVTEDMWPQSRAEYEAEFIAHAEEFHQTTLSDYDRNV